MEQRLILHIVDGDSRSRAEQAALLSPSAITPKSIPISRNCSTDRRTTG